MKQRWLVTMAVIGVLLTVGIGRSSADDRKTLNVPKLREKAILTYAPEVPPPIKRKQPALVEIHMKSLRKTMEIKPGKLYEFWTFDGHVPGPFIRVREGDVIEVHHTSEDITGMPHNIDFHAVTGPGGGAPVTTVVAGEERIAWFKMLQPGLYVYHCAAPPVMDHIANGMYGLILVEPKHGLSRVDKEFYVFQSEFYASDPAEDLVKKVEVGHDHRANAGVEKKEDFWGAEEATTDQPETVLLPFSHQDGLDEHPRFIVFNGKVGSLTQEGVLKAKVGEKVRIFFGNGGPNLISSFHVIGEIFDNVYREGDLISPPAHSIQTTLVPAGGSTVVEFGLEVP
ncbi:MAG: multicopper oxidase domain-containing protein, partial [Candidatus Omnitrophota bacterium]|nr:multicopper oxidase domain-containing protein [Candidatus Omnitrophota bacterium]